MKNILLATIAAIPLLASFAVSQKLYAQSDALAKAKLEAAQMAECLVNHQMLLRFNTMASVSLTISGINSGSRTIIGVSRSYLAAAADDKKRIDNVLEVVNTKILSRLDNNDATTLNQFFTQKKSEFEQIAMQKYLDEAANDEKKVDYFSGLLEKRISCNELVEAFGVTDSTDDDKDEN